MLLRREREEANWNRTHEIHALFWNEKVCMGFAL